MKGAMVGVVKGGRRNTSVRETRVVKSDYCVQHHLCSPDPCIERDQIWLAT